MNERERQDLCRRLGIKNEAEVYQLVMQAAKTGTAVLIKRGLKANELRILGYSRDNLKKLRFPEDLLAQLGFHVDVPAPAAPVAAAASSPAADAPDGLTSDKGRALVMAGTRAPELKQKGWSLGHLRKAGCTPTELERVGFHLDEMAGVFSAAELRRSGYGVRDLRRLFRGNELKDAGFDAADMRNAGYNIRELLNIGYSENAVRTAGFSINELAREGLSKQTVDKTKMGY